MTKPDRTFTHTVGQQIAAARRAARLTQAELATRLDWPRDTLIHYENGRRAITVDRVAQIADALAVPPATLLLDDAVLAALLRRLAQEPDLLTQVRFFLNTLDTTAAELDAPSHPS